MEMEKYGKFPESVKFILFWMIQIYLLSAWGLVVQLQGTTMPEDFIQPISLPQQREVVRSSAAIESEGLCLTNLSPPCAKGGEFCVAKLGGIVCTYCRFVALAKW